ncbi:MAG: hypothetical protein NTW86_01040, partial [Candidatus Sumerlaeota bacterium]|nr:hypothetical protein [Candidatus Sumerlaeota bacterium]
SPAGAHPDGAAVFWPAAAYFMLIGAGFMFVEIALMQRLSVFLGHPIYALGILLFTLIASAGLGSLLSERLPLTRRPWAFVFPVAIGAAILGVRFLLPEIAAAMESAPRLPRILASIATIGPLGACMGVCFPTGMRLARRARGAETPWYFALNGIIGVLCSAVAVFVSIYFGISKSLYVASACYLLLLTVLPAMLRETREAPTL